MLVRGIPVQEGALWKGFRDCVERLKARSCCNAVTQQVIQSLKAELVEKECRKHHDFVSICRQGKGSTRCSGIQQGSKGVLGSRSFVTVYRSIGKRWLHRVMFLGFFCLFLFPTPKNLLELNLLSVEKAKPKGRAIIQ